MSTSGEPVASSAHVGPIAILAFTILAATVGLGVVAAPAPVHAQDPTEPTARPPADLPAPLDISPGGAFWRALVFPGWGHAAIDSHARGGFYVAAQGATIYTLLRARTRVGVSQDRVRFREEIVLERLAVEGITDDETIQQRLEEDATLSELRGLLDARKEQQEDMVALGIFFLFIGAADAYVSAHLGRFPEPLELEARPGPAGPVVDVGLSLPLGR